MTKPTKSDRQAAQRAMATVREVLGRDPRAEVFVGGPGLIQRPAQKSKRAKR